MGKFIMSIVRLVGYCVLLGLAFIHLGCDMGVKSKTLSEEQKVIETARKFLNSLGIQLKDKLAVYDYDHKEWEMEYRYLRSVDSLEGLDVLKGREYHAVYYVPKNSLTLGGIYWVFIDKKTNEVIHWFGML